MGRTTVGGAMSRKAADHKFNWKDVNRFLRERGVTLVSVGLDEVPMAHKNIREVMAAQTHLVTVLGKFDPRPVKMVSNGEPPENYGATLSSRSNRWGGWSKAGHGIRLPVD